MTSFLSYYMVSEWRPVFPFGETVSDEGGPKPQARPFLKKSLEGCMQESITG
jgi:hypothetical protein